MSEAQTLIRGPQLRKRWGMSNSAFYEKVRQGVIPKPSYPFGNNTPYWSISDIEAFERRAVQPTAAA